MQDSKKKLAELNQKISQLPPKERRKEAKKQLYGGSPIKDLLDYQRATLSPRILAKKRIDPAVAVQLYAMQKGGIRSATRCAAAVEAARRASTTAHSPSLARKEGRGLTIKRQSALIKAFEQNRRISDAARENALTLIRRKQTV
jgi:hypothetical protein